MKYFKEVFHYSSLDVSMSIWYDYDVMNSMRNLHQWLVDLLKSIVNHLWTLS